MLFDWINFSYLCSLFFFLICFLKYQFNIQIFFLVGKFFTKTILLFLWYNFIINFERIQLFKLLFALLMTFLLKFHPFPIKIIRRMSFSLYRSPWSLNWFLMFNLCFLFLFLLHHLPLLINLFTIRWILIFTFLLQLLLYFRY